MSSLGKAYTNKEYDELIARVEQSFDVVNYNPEECPICGGSGSVVILRDDDYTGVRECICRKVVEYRNMLKKSGISEAFRNKTFDNFIEWTDVVKQAKKMAVEYVKKFSEIKQQPNNSIAFLGQVGAGKTHLTIAIANELMKKLIGVLYMPYREAILRLKQNIMDEENYWRTIEEYKTCPVLLIDDLFKGKITDSDIGIIFEIINYRYFTGLPIIVSSEYRVKDLLQVDEAVGSRIIEMCKGYLMEFNGKELNYRLKGGG
ncbi:DnaA ATPase domain-containing protein [Caldanaerobacter subterraneus]|uniref:DNA replication protein DnaC n=1 Tax=Caldanaerobacter subterraneus subsp. pacificus DSM 12653 TaxID=391606 RepID=B7R6S0_9THEO|nr:DnaA/Hda family protein [Caldanaerobacter subterraneus]KKC30919.1 DNA replication protein DnaC [Caldanaerobacter subterraneus subsp. pacificus DSM 12653]